jgi:hypothetical protein
VFGEPGGALRFKKNRTDPESAFYAGGRYHFFDAVTLALRVGHPVATVGASFLL